MTMATLKSPRPTPNFFPEAESFSTKKSRPTPKEQGPPPKSPVKSAPPISRLFGKPVQQRAKAISFRECDSLLNSKLYNESRKESYFEQCFEIQSRLGVGSFGEVFKVRSREDGRFYAVKKSREKFRGDSDRTRKLEEVKKHEELPRHPNCVRFVRAWEERHHLYIQTELCETSLGNYSEQNHDIAEGLVWKYVVDLLQAVKHLHDHDLVHLDIKPENIFVSGSGICKLGDFGLVLDLRKGDTSEAIEGDPKYLAPELMEGKFTQAADIFSLGVSILELACDLNLPHGGETWQQLRRGNIPGQFIGHLSPLLQQTIRSMMHHNHLLRPTASDLLSLPHIKKVLTKRKLEVKARNVGYVLWTAIGSIWWLLYLCISKPYNWVRTRLKTTNASTPKSIGRSHEWADHSFSDDEDLLDSSDGSSIAAPLSDSSGEANVSGSVPVVLSSCQANCSPMGRRRVNWSHLTPVPFRLQPTRCSTPNLSPQVDDDSLRLGPRNLMRVFDAADDDSCFL